MNASECLGIPEAGFNENAIAVLAVLRTTNKNARTPITILNASIAFVGGYIVRTILERIDCSSCIQLVRRQPNRDNISQLIEFRDVGGLQYPTDSLVSILCTLQRFVELSIEHILKEKSILEKMTIVARPYMLNCPALQCDEFCNNDKHIQLLTEIILEKYLRPILTNYAINSTDLNNKDKKNLKINLYQERF